MTETCTIKRWLIWSNEHRKWWAYERRGYVDIIELAGRYSFEEALEIVRSANLVSGDIPNECMVPADT